MNVAVDSRFESEPARRRLRSGVAKKSTRALSPCDWHPVIRDIVATMSRDAWEPELDAQFADAEKVAALEKTERHRVTRELGALASKLENAGQPEAARVLASIAVLGDGAQDSLFAAQRLLGAN